jgi:hypothetical protein
VHHWYKWYKYQLNATVTIYWYSDHLNMSRAIILPIFRSTRLCVTACGIMHPRCCQPAAWKRRDSASRPPGGIIPVHYTTSCNTQPSAPEDESDHRPKHVELIGIINKPLLLHLVGVYIIYTRTRFGSDLRRCSRKLNILIVRNLKRMALSKILNNDNLRVILGLTCCI